MSEGTEATLLVVVVTNDADAVAVSSWLAPQLPSGNVVVASGYYAAIVAVDRRSPAVVMDVGIPSGRDDWRLAELRTRLPQTPIVVIADATLMPRLTGTLRADLSVATVADLPPLRELLLTDDPVVTGGDQTSWRRSSR